MKLIAKNAMTYNDVGSIYYFAAKKLLNIADYLFSKVNGGSKNFQKNIHE